MFKAFKDFFILPIGKTSGRSDDNAETIRNRIKNFDNLTKPVLDFYWRFGRVENINSVGEIEKIYSSLVPVLNPNIIYFYGAPCLGKSTVAKSLAKRINFQILDLESFCKQNGLNTR